MVRVKILITTILVVMLVLLAAMPVAVQAQDALQYTDEVRVSKPERQFVRVTGVLMLQGTTYYQYGSHVIADLRTGNSYALYSRRGINLDRYVSRVVMLVGKRVEGYPIDSGPRS